MRLAALALAIAACGDQAEDWHWERSQPIELRLVGIASPDDVERLLDGVEAWRRACGRQMFKVVESDHDAPHAVNVTIGETEDGMAHTNCLGDRCTIVFSGSVGDALLAIHETGHVLIGMGYENTDPYHSTDPASVMHEGWLTGSERITATDMQLACRW